MPHVELAGGAARRPSRERLSDSATGSARRAGSVAAGDRAARLPGLPLPLLFAASTGLESLADEAEELAANVFGTLLHAVLKQFADDPQLADCDRSGRARSRFE